VRGNVAAYIHHATVGAGSVSVNAVEHAQISSIADSAAKAAGGNSFGGGYQIAGNATIATNTVQSQANAYIDDAAVTTTGTGAVALDAENISNIDAIVLSATTSGD